jgi:hypothetical protein
MAASEHVLVILLLAFRHLQVSFWKNQGVPDMLFSRPLRIILFK